MPQHDRIREDFTIDVQEHINKLASDLRGAETFETGARHSLRLVRDIACDALEARPDARQWMLLRGMVQIRSSNDHYQSLVIEEYGEGDRHLPDGALHPSNTAWTLVKSCKGSVGLDVVTRTFVHFPTDFPEAPARHLEAPSEHQPSDSTSTFQSLEARNATHVLALPILDQARVVGALSVELNCRSEIGSLMPCEHLVRDLATIVTVATPYLLALPLRAPTDSAVDTQDVLPVPSRWAAGMMDLLHIFSRQPQTILISGPTGGGKSVLARWTHDQSNQRGSFVTAPLNEVGDDTSLPQLFGWRRGSFTGADRDRPGWVDQAENGTLFLDDIDGLSLNQQEGLLRFFDTGHYRRMGESQDRQLKNVRFVVATNANLPQLVVEGSFREDLFHRINGFPIEVPPLSERTDEIPHWSERFAQNVHTEARLEGSVQITANAMATLIEYQWPGNLRELARTVQYAHALAQVDHPPPAAMMTLDEQQVRTALGQTRRGSSGNPVGLLYRTAKALLSQAIREQRPLEIQVLQGRGLLFDMIWLVALQAFGDHSTGREKTTKLLDLEQARESRNYAKLQRRSFVNLQAYYRAHGQPLPAELATRISSK